MEIILFGLLKTCDKIVPWNLHNRTDSQVLSILFTFMAHEWTRMVRFSFYCILTEYDPGSLYEAVVFGSLEKSWNL